MCCTPDYYFRMLGWRLGVLSFWNGEGGGGGFPRWWVSKADTTVFSCSSAGNMSLFFTVLHFTLLLHHPLKQTCLYGKQPKQQVQTVSTLPLTLLFKWAPNASFGYFSSTHNLVFIFKTGFCTFSVFSHSLLSFVTSLIFGRRFGKHQD